MSFLIELCYVSFRFAYSSEGTRRHSNSACGAVLRDHAGGHSARRLSPRPAGYIAGRVLTDGISAGGALPALSLSKSKRGAVFSDSLPFKTRLRVAAAFKGLLPEISSTHLDGDEQRSARKKTADDLQGRPSAIRGPEQDSIAWVPKRVADN